MLSKVRNTVYYNYETYKSEVDSLLNESYLNALILTDEDAYFDLTNKDIKKINDIEISLNLLMHLFLDNTVYKHMVNNIYHHNEYVIDIACKNERIKYTLEQVQELMKYVDEDTILSYYHRSFGDIPPLIKNKIQSRRMVVKLVTKKKTKKDSINIDGTLYNEIVKGIDSIYSDTEVAIALYINLCLALTYDKETTYNKKTREVNKDTFLSIYQFFLSRFGINYELDTVGNIVINTNEFRFQVLNSEMIISNDLINLIQVNGIIPINENIKLNAKFNENIYQVYSNIIENNKIRNVSEMCLLEYKRKYSSIDMTFREKVSLMLKCAALREVQGPDIIPYYTSMFNKLFKHIPGISINFMTDIDKENNQMNSNPLIVLGIHYDDDIFIVIDTTFFNETKTFDKEGYRRFVSSHNFDLKEIPEVKLGEYNVSETTQESKRVI